MYKISVPTSKQLPTAPSQRPTSLDYWNKPCL